MKFLALALLACGTMSAFAQNTPASVCQTVSRFNGASGAACAQSISRGSFDQSAVDVAAQLANQGSHTNAAQVMQISVNAYLDDGVGPVCITVARFNGASGVECVRVSLDNAFDPGVLSIAQQLANQGSHSNAITALSNGKNAAVNPAAAAVCVTVARFNGANGAACVTAILNKDYFNNSESVCATLASQGSHTNAVACLSNSGVVTQRRPGRRGRPGRYGDGPGQGPGPSVTNVLIPAQQYENLLRDIGRARMQHNRYDMQRLGETLQQIEQTLQGLRRQ